MVKRKTDKEFKKEVYNLVGNEYVFLDLYVNANTKIRVKHNNCGNIYEVYPNSFLHGNRCPYCARCRKTDKEFKQEVFDLVGKEYVFLEHYQGALTKIKVKHNKCNHVYSVAPTNFLRGGRCPYCSSKAKKTDKQFKQEVYDLVGNEYTFLDPYVNSYTKIKVKHNKCGNTYEVGPHSFLQGSRCPYCYIKDKRKTNKQFKQEVYDLVDSEYTFLDLYVDTRTKIKVKHNKCGNIYEVSPNSFLHGSRCPYCYGTPKKIDEDFKQEVYGLVGNDYTFLDSYVSNKTKIKVKHNKCGNIYEVRPTDFFSHQTRCPYCNSPKGETIITKLLDIFNLNYEYQKSFDDLKDVQPLSYDFYLPDQSILIEYQGLQHYQPIDYFGGETQFAIQQKHDQMKFDYAKDHGYNLITVPYTEDTFSKIKKYLIKHGLKR